MPGKIINRLTGKEPTAKEWEQIKARAEEILGSAYAAPEQIAWAADMHPEYYAKVALLPLHRKNDAR